MICFAQGKLIAAGLDKHLMKGIRAGPQGLAPRDQQPCAGARSPSNFIPPYGGNELTYSHREDMPTSCQMSDIGCRR